MCACEGVVPQEDLLKRGELAEPVEPALQARAGAVPPAIAADVDKLTASIKHCVRAMPVRGMWYVPDT